MGYPDGSGGAVSSGAGPMKIERDKILDWGVSRPRVGSEPGIIQGMNGNGRRKPGPQPKGDRSAFTIRIPMDHRPVVEDAARAAGMSLGDYVATILAQQHNLPEPEYLSRNKDQRALPISA